MRTTRSAPLIVALALWCGACESSKTFEPVRAEAIGAATSGTVQGIVSTALTDSVAVKVTDQRSNPMRNAQVSWTVAEGNITPTSTTDDNGIARAKWTFGPTLGQQVATASVGSLTTQITATTRGIWKSIQVAYTGACGLTTAGTPLCWGLNEAGQLGLGSGTAGNPARSQVPVAVATSQKLQDLRISWAHACGFTAANAAYCWGLNSTGQLGVGVASTSNCPTVTDDAGKQCMPAATAVSGGLAFISITVGFRHSCGLARDGKAYCWGRNTEGQLGIGAADAAEHSSPAAVAGGLTFSSISAGFAYTCGVTTTGQGYCWGNNNKGELGTGRNERTSVPTLVAGGLTFSSITASSAFTTCGVTTAQKAYCWGWNEYGQLGNANTDSLSYSPVAVSGTLTFASVYPATFHTCALSPAGAAYCWGGDADGQLGYARSPLTLCVGVRCNRVPDLVAGGLAFATLSTSVFNSCGVTTLGGGFCWGANDFGQLGNGSTTPRNSPVQVSNPAGVSLP